MAIELTQDWVDGIKIEKGRRLVADAHCKGLYLDLRPTGRSWRYRYTDINGKLISVTIGDASKVSLQAARKKADLMTTRRPSRNKAEAPDQTPLYGDFVRNRYLPFATSTKKSAEWEEIIQRCHLVPAFGNLRLNEITRGAMSEFILGKQAAGYKAGSINRMIAILKVTLSKSVEWETPGMAVNPAKGVKLLKDPPKIDRFLSQEEAEKLLASIRGSTSPLLGYIVPFLLFTGARKREALDAKWEHIDWRNALWTIPITKSGKPRVVPLSAQAVELLRKLSGQRKALRINQSPWLFPNPDTGKPYVTIFHVWDRCRKSVGLGNVRIHDLRHSFASALVNRGMTLYDVKEALGHANIITTQRYAHLTPQRLREAVRQAGDFYGSLGAEEASSDEPRPK